MMVISPAIRLARRLGAAFQAEVLLLAPEETCRDVHSCSAVSGRPFPPSAKAAAAEGAGSSGKYICPCHIYLVTYG